MNSILKNWTKIALQFKSLRQVTFLKEINTFIWQGQIKLIKGDSEDFYFSIKYIFIFFSVKDFT